MKDTDWFLVAATSGAIIAGIAAQQYLMVDHEDAALHTFRWTRNELRKQLQGGITRATSYSDRDPIVAAALQRDAARVPIVALGERLPSIPDWNSSVWTSALGGTYPRERTTLRLACTQILWGGILEEVNQALRIREKGQVLHHITPDVTSSVVTVLPRKLVYIHEFQPMDVQTLKKKAAVIKIIATVHFGVGKVYGCDVVVKH